MAKFTNSGLVKSGDIAFKVSWNIRTMVKTKKKTHESSDDIAFNKK